VATAVAEAPVVVIEVLAQALEVVAAVLAVELVEELEVVVRLNPA
jgi:hypothetical protein